MSGPAKTTRNALGFVVLLTLVWWGAGAIAPDADQLTRLSLRAAVPEGITLTASGWDPATEPGCRALALAVLGDGLTLDDDGAGNLRARCEGEATARLELRVGGETEPTVIEGAVPTGHSVIPPVLAVLIALFFRRVLVALLGCIVLGALMTEGWAPLAAIERTTVTYLWGTLDLEILGFTCALLGMVGVCIAMGGMHGMVHVLARVARGVRSTQAATGLMGLAIFFDDYANSIIVGTTARTLTDKWRISREKLAYIVDSTAAPVAGLAVVSTWVAFEMGLFESHIGAFGEGYRTGGDVFLAMLPYRFYCIFALALVFMVAWTGRDIGPMVAAERRARETGAVTAPGGDGAASGHRGARLKEGAPHRWINGVLPVAVVVTGSLVSALVAGDGSLALNTEILLWWSIGGAALAMVMARLQGILTVGEALGGFVDGVRHALPTLAVLVCAMAIRGVTDDLGSGIFLGALLTDVTPWLLPFVTFALAGFIAFSTGTSWGTMGILMPVALPLAATLTVGDPNQGLLMLLVAGSVLDGAIFGDHCSVISDTTVMSSAASGCDHVDHVRTQIPYALVAMMAAGVAGYMLLPWFASGGAWLSYGVGLLLMFLVLRLAGRRTAP